MPGLDDGSEIMPADPQPPTQPSRGGRRSSSRGRKLAPGRFLTGPAQYLPFNFVEYRRENDLPLDLRPTWLGRDERLLEPGENPYDTGCYKFAWSFVPPAVTAVFIMIMVTAFSSGKPFSKENRVILLFFLALFTSYMLIYTFYSNYCTPKNSIRKFLPLKSQYTYSGPRGNCSVIVRLTGIEDPRQIQMSEICMEEAREPGVANDDSDADSVTSFIIHEEPSEPVGWRCSMM